MQSCMCISTSASHVYNVHGCKYIMFFFRDRRVGGVLRYCASLSPRALLRLRVSNLRAFTSRCRPRLSRAS